MSTAGTSYEYSVADYLRKNGYSDVEVTKASGDYGVDVTAYRSGIKYAVQCKYYSKPVGLDAVQEVVAGKAYYNCDCAMVVTNNTFTESAITLAKHNGVILLDNVIGVNADDTDETIQNNEKTLASHKKYIFSNESNINDFDVDAENRELECSPYRFPDIDFLNDNYTEHDTVYLRLLIDDPAFKKEDSLWVSCGATVAGHGVYFDIAKMPHLIISDATGMGKLACINCLIMSLLYRARPDEVKLILVDPKRIEFKPYEGLPHLLVPVVSDPKKAAGSLSWAVNEMERRFSLIEEAGVRDITGYNRSVMKDHQERELLPRIVIIIDELAELIMTAKDTVEASICRIAQKAHIVGMHLVIGTQSLPINVIMGLVKTSVSSIMFSKIDARTIIECESAKSFLNKADILFKPVGSKEPLRMRGAFVSDEEVERVVEFITSQGCETDEDELVAEIEREVARCDSGKKGDSLSQPGENGVEEDQMLIPALELAVESGKISTSFIQRRLSLGYGRAAKIIYRMEQLGYVGAPDGQRPREVLITDEKLMELKLGWEDKGYISYHQQRQTFTKPNDATVLDEITQNKENEKVTDALVHMNDDDSYKSVSGNDLKNYTEENNYASLVVLEITVMGFLSFISDDKQRFYNCKANDSTPVLVCLNDLKQIENLDIYGKYKLYALFVRNQPSEKFGSIPVLFALRIEKINHKDELKSTVFWKKARACLKNIWLRIWYSRPMQFVFGFILCCYYLALVIIAVTVVVAIYSSIYNIRVSAINGDYEGLIVYVCSLIGIVAAVVGVVHIVIKMRKNIKSYGFKGLIKKVIPGNKAPKK